MVDINEVQVEGTFNLESTQVQQLAAVYSTKIMIYITVSALFSLFCIHSIGASHKAKKGLISSSVVGASAAPI